VTGGGSGIGRAISLLFAAAGARVAVLDVDREGAEQTVRDAAGEAEFFPCDVRRQAEVAEVFERVGARFSPVDVLVNNAGIAHVGNVEQTSEEDLDRVYSVNVKGVYNCLRAGVERMKGRGGVVLNLASVASTAGIADRFAYGMSKGAVHTPFVDGFLHRSYPGREQEMFEQLSKTQPIGRMGEPEEIARLALFLCSDDASFITGSNYPIDGGFLTLKM
jgi:NAD(P)-dependent dehydrogenase (short-subunit alcohol dehydrogenase family)